MQIYFFLEGHYFLDIQYVCSRREENLERKMKRLSDAGFRHDQLTGCSQKFFVGSGSSYFSCNERILVQRTLNFSFRCHFWSSRQINIEINVEQIFLMFGLIPLQRNFAEGSRKKTLFLMTRTLRGGG